MRLLTLTIDYDETSDNGRHVAELTVGDEPVLCVELFGTSAMSLHSKERVDVLGLVETANRLIHTHKPVKRVNFFSVSPEAGGQFPQSSEADHEASRQAMRHTSDAIAAAVESRLKAVEDNHRVSSSPTPAAHEQQDGPSVPGSAASSRQASTGCGTPSAPPLPL